MYENQPKRLQDELERLIKLVSWAREALENELMGTDAPLTSVRKLSITPKDMERLRDLAIVMEKAVGAKIRFDKASKELADLMTPEEEFESVVTYVRALGPDKIARFMQAIKYVPVKQQADQVRANEAKELLESIKDLERSS